MCCVVLCCVYTGNNISIFICYIYYIYVYDISYIYYSQYYSVIQVTLQIIVKNSKCFTFLSISSFVSVWPLVLSPE